jgi:hypothetical protein
MKQNGSKPTQLTFSNPVTNVSRGWIDSPQSLLKENSMIVLSDSCLVTTLQIRTELVALDTK